ncbi:MAG: ferrous iron transport protein B [Syntrophomonadales bacterium]|jgi:ferrous iron transport protein B
MSIVLEKRPEREKRPAPITVAVAGNPNSGKTSIFNNLTGSHQQVGNWPGVTVTKKEGQLVMGSTKARIVDLPGIYSLGAYSEDEMVARDYILSGEPDVIIDVVDAGNIERNLYLTTQMLEAGGNIVIALNMLDEARRQNIHIDVRALADRLGIPVVPTVARLQQGMKELVEAVLEAAGQSKPKPFRIYYGELIESELEILEELVKTVPELTARLHPRYVAVKLLEDEDWLHKKIEALNGDTRERLMMAAGDSINRLRKHYGEDLDSALIEQRYSFIADLLKGVVTRSEDKKEKDTFTEVVDRVVLNRYLGIPIFLLVMFGMFQTTFTLGAPLSDMIETFFAWLGGWVAGGISSPLMSSLIVDAVIGGVGSVLVFVPPIFLLFLIISILEDSGYMARAAYIMDRFMQNLGLHGRSFIPLLIGFGCNVPAVMAARSLENKGDRLTTILIAPLMSCAARLPVYVLFVGIFFTAYQGLAVFSLYLLGIVLAIIAAHLFKKFLFRGEEAPFILEIPPYRIPTLKTALLHMWERGSQFLKKAGTIIFAAVVLVWAMSNLPWGVEYASQESLMGMMGSWLAPVFEPLGFGTWQAASALIFGLLAKEIVVGTLAVVYGAGEVGLAAAISSAYTPLSAFSFMVMVLVYSPCVATIAAIRRETDSRGWTAFAIGYSLVLGWVLALTVYQGGKLLGLG